MPRSITSLNEWLVSNFNSIREREHDTNKQSFLKRVDNTCTNVDANVCES